MATIQDFVNWVCTDAFGRLFSSTSSAQCGPSLIGWSWGSTHQTIYMPDVGGLVCPIPPLDEQDGIVQCIRSETAKIDRLTVNVRAAIERLREYRAALVSAAVTGKIDVRGDGPDRGVDLEQAADRAGLSG
jgi:type I restriction enzyme S subunit